MTLWDGLTSASSTGLPAQIVVLGATNRINDIDEAILRRMPKKFPVTLPGLQQRRRILQLVLQDAKLDSEHFDLDHISGLTSGMSGSDIKEACRDAAMAPIREYMQRHKGERRQLAAVDSTQIRGIRTDDFLGKKCTHTLRNDGNQGAVHCRSTEKECDIAEVLAIERHG